MDVFPIPPAPIKVIRVRVSARPLAFLISSSHLKRSSGEESKRSKFKYARCKCEVLGSLAVKATDLVWTWATVSILMLPGD